MKRRKAMLAGYFFWFLSMSMLATIAGTNIEPVVRLDFTTGNHKGVKSVVYHPVSPRTVYNESADRLDDVDVKNGEPRYESYPNNPVGKNCGVLLERRASNSLTNSSFERGLDGWNSKEKFDVRVVEGGFHGAHAVLLNGTGEFSHAPVGFNGREENWGWSWGCLSAYFCGTPEDVQKQVQMFVYAVAEDGSRGPDLIEVFYTTPRKVEEGIQKIQYIQRPGSKWTRMVAYFSTPRKNLKYEAGFKFSQAQDIKMDAVQLELKQTDPGPAASSYIPTGDSAQTRENEYCEVRTDEFPMEKQGSLILWYHGVNHGANCAYGILFDNCSEGKSDGIRLWLDGVIMGSKDVRILHPYEKLTEPEKSNWHSIALTWDGTQARLYFDGKENSAYDGPFGYGNLSPYMGRFVLGNPLHGSLEGVISYLEIYSQALTAQDIGRLCGQTTVAQETVAVVGTPVPYHVAKEGRVSVGIYDQAGVLRRQLVLGELRKPGDYTAYWDGKDDNGALLPSGKYEFRGVVNDIKAEWRASVGNSGEPPWGKTKVRGGMPLTVAVNGPNIVANTPQLEGGCGTQCFSPDGKVLWTGPYDPVYGEDSAIACDGKFIYVVGMVANEKNAEGRAILREVLWRLNAGDGSLVPWPDQDKVVDLNKPRVFPPLSPSNPTDFLRYSWDIPEERFNDPQPYFEIRGIAVSGNRLYAPFFRENRILILDAKTGRPAGEIANVSKPKGIAVTEEGLLVVSEKRILKYRFNGLLEGVFTDGLSAPYAIAVSPRTGEVYVTDLGDSHQVKVFSRNGKFLKAIGPKWDPSPVRDGRLDRLFFPTGLAFDAEGRLVVADYMNGRVLYYDGQDKICQSIEAFGFTGSDGGVAFLPGEPGIIYTLNVMMQQRWCRNIVVYSIDQKRKIWQVAHRWQDVSPVGTGDHGMRVRRLANGRTYIFMPETYPTVYEITNDGKLCLCAALLHPHGWGYLEVTSNRPDWFKDAKKLGLFNEKGEFHCFIVWTDTNRDGRIQKDELKLDESWTTPGEFTMDMDVDENGNLLLADNLSRSRAPIVYQLPMQGFDGAGNPLYDWSLRREVVDLTKCAGLETETWEWYMTNPNIWITYGLKKDATGSVYLGQSEGNHCVPDDVRLLKIGAGNQLLWKVGRKTVGLKTKPGQLDGPHQLFVMDGVVYVLDYIATVDLYTTEGLFLATLLDMSKAEDSPYSNWGENFSGDVVKDRQTGKTFFLINSHNYVLPFFEVVGLDTVKRFQGSVVLSDDILSKVRARGSEKKPVSENMSFIYPLSSLITVDGNLDDWKGIPAKRSVIDGRDELYAEYRYGYDNTNLYLAFAVGDPTPAINSCVDEGDLWDGDCLELYISRNPVHGLPWQPGDHIIHFAACEQTDRSRVGFMSNSGVGLGWNVIKPKPPEVKEIKTETRIWPSRRGYNLEACIPLKALGIEQLRAGQRILLDWDIVYNTGQDNPSKAGFKLYRVPPRGGEIIRTPGLWGPGRVLRAVGEEHAVYAHPLAGDWDRLSVQAELHPEGVEDAYRAEMKVGYDERNLRFFFNVRDPDPGLVTAGASFIGMGDFMEVFLNSLPLYVVASPVHPKPYLIKENSPCPIEVAKSTITVGKDSYLLEVVVPWEAIGGKRKNYSFNWQTGWSDRTGGGSFAKKMWRDAAAAGTLVVLPEP